MALLHCMAWELLITEMPTHSNTLRWSRCYSVAPGTRGTSRHVLLDLQICRTEFTDVPENWSKNPLRWSLSCNVAPGTWGTSRNVLLDLYICLKIHLEHAEVKPVLEWGPVVREEQVETYYWIYAYAWPNSQMCRCNYLLNPVMLVMCACPIKMCSWFWTGSSPWRPVQDYLVSRQNANQHQQKPLLKWHVQQQQWFSISNSKRNDGLAP